MTRAPAVRIFPNLRSGCIFVSLGETFRRDGRSSSSSSRAGGHDFRLDFPIPTPRTDRSNPRENLKGNHFTPAQRNVGFFFLKWNFSLTIRCKVKEKIISNGIIGLVILRKRRGFLCFLFELWFPY